MNARMRTVHFLRCVIRFCKTHAKNKQRAGMQIAEPRDPRIERDQHDHCLDSKVPCSERQSEQAEGPSLCSTAEMASSSAQRNRIEWETNTILNEVRSHNLAKQY